MMLFAKGSLDLLPIKLMSNPVLTNLSVIHIMTCPMLSLTAHQVVSGRQSRCGEWGEEVLLEMPTSASIYVFLG